MRVKPGIVAVLDIGDTKVVCFIAVIDHTGALRITGIGHQVARGMRGGLITDIGEVESSIVAAVHAAEQMAGETIENVMVSLSGSGVTSRNISVELEVAGSSVTERDMVDLIQEGSASVTTDKLVMVHGIPVSYFLDDSRGIKDPRGLFGKRLGAELHLVLAPSALLKNLSHCIARCHLNVTKYIVSSYASGLACLEPDEMELGVTVIDLGGGVTSISVFVGGKLLYVDSVPMGGIHVTSDIAKGLSTTLQHAERIKTLQGSAIAANGDGQIMIEVPQLGEDETHESHLVPRAMLGNIIRPRMEEILEAVRSRLDAGVMEKIAGRRVVLTGGAAQLLGVRELAGQVLGKQVRIGRPREVAGLAEAVAGPAFSTAIGMLQFVDRKMIETDVLEHVAEVRRETTRFQRLVGWFKENF
ncbi:MAG: cell division protein FtsA [Alphaproteobacteria bacterium]|nr:cell division protein FtsA [Alphaproteobacteria bacterium]